MYDCDYSVPDMQLRDKAGMTPLMLAAKYGHKNVSYILHKTITMAQFER